tara:strand:- start:73 stop:609 length:537 start_codon:yes stop_codon:yes gene_type:complete
MSTNYSKIDKEDVKQVVGEVSDKVQNISKELESKTGVNKNLYLVGLFLIPIISFLMPILTTYLLLLLGTIVAILHIKYDNLNKEFGPGSRVFEVLPHIIKWYVWYPFLVLITKPIKVLKLIPKDIGKLLSGILYYSYEIVMSLVNIAGKQIDVVFYLIGGAENVIQYFGKVLAKIFKS